MLESFRNNGDIYIVANNRKIDFLKLFFYAYVTVISKTLEHIKTFNTNCKVVS